MSGNTEETITVLGGELTVETAFVLSSPSSIRHTFTEVLLLPRSGHVTPALRERQWFSMGIVRPEALSPPPASLCLTFQPDISSHLISSLHLSPHHSGSYHPTDTHIVSRCSRLFMMTTFPSCPKTTPRTQMKSRQTASALSGCSPRWISVCLKVPLSTPSHRVPFAHGAACGSFCICSVLPNA